MPSRDDVPSTGPTGPAQPTDQAAPEDEAYAGRRQLGELSAADLRSCGVWWFPGPGGDLGGPDELTVLPLDTGEALPDGSLVFPAGRYLLHALCTLADGSVLDGHVTLATDDAGGLRDREPTLCAPDGHVPLWHGVVEPPVSDYLAALGRARAKVFPLTWETRFRPTGDTLRGAVAGFAVWRGDAIEYV